MVLSAEVGIIGDVLFDIDSHRADNFESALSIMTTTEQDFMVFPMATELFNFDFQVKLTDRGEVLDLEKGIYYQNKAQSMEVDIEDKAININIENYLDDIGVAQSATGLAGEISKVFQQFYALYSQNYKMAFKILTKTEVNMSWHKDRNDCDNYDHPEYNIGLAITSPGTLFCLASKQDRFDYDNKMEEEAAFEKKCATDLLYEVPKFSGVIFRSCDDYAAIHSSPLTEYRLFAVIELNPISSGG